MVLHAWAQGDALDSVAGSGRWTRWQWALDSVAVGAPADEISIMPTRRADSAGASSMIESDSISVVSDAARGDKTVHEEDHSSTMPRSCLLWRSWHG